MKFDLTTQTIIKSNTVTKAMKSPNFLLSKKSFPLFSDWLISKLDIKLERYSLLNLNYVSKTSGFKIESQKYNGLFLTISFTHIRKLNFGLNFSMLFTIYNNIGVDKVI